MTSINWELTPYEQHRKPHETLPGNTEIAVSPCNLHSELQCPICLDILTNTMTTKECLHRFCSECITTALRNGNKECPTCRKKLVSHRSLRKDTTFDAIVSRIFPDRSVYEEQVEKRIAKLMKMNVNDRYSAQAREKGGGEASSESPTDDSNIGALPGVIELQMKCVGEFADADKPFFTTKYFSTSPNASMDHLVEFLKIRYKAFSRQRQSDGNEDIANDDLSSVECNYEISIVQPSNSVTPDSAGNASSSSLDGQMTLTQLFTQHSSAMLKEPFQLLYMPAQSAPARAAPKMGKTKRKRDPNKPKRAMSAYFHFLQYCREQAQKEGKSFAKIAEFSKLCAERWRNMNGEEKLPFDERAKEDKGRYDREMKLHKPVRDPNKPKKPQSAYFLFLARFREEMKESGMTHRDILKHAGERWNQMNEEEKHPFQVDAERGKRVYDQQMIEFNQKRMQQQQAERRAEQAAGQSTSTAQPQQAHSGATHGHVARTHQQSQPAHQQQQQQQQQAAQQQAAQQQQQQQAAQQQAAQQQAAQQQAQQQAFYNQGGGQPQNGVPQGAAAMFPFGGLPMSAQFSPAHLQQMAATGYLGYGTPASAGYGAAGLPSLHNMMAMTQPQQQHHQQRSPPGAVPGQQQQMGAVQVDMHGAS